MSDLLTRQQIADMAGIAPSLIPIYSKTKHTRFPRYVLKRGLVYYYDREEGEQWVKDYERVYVRREVAALKRPPFSAPLRFQLTMDQQIDLDIKLLKAKKNKPITQIVNVKEIDLYARP